MPGAIPARDAGFERARRSAGSGTALSTMRRVPVDDRAAPGAGSARRMASAAGRPASTSRCTTCRARSSSSKPSTRHSRIQPLGLALSLVVAVFIRATSAT